MYDCGMEPQSAACSACDVVQWLASEAPPLTFSGRMLDGFAARLQAAGVPVARMTLHVQVLNPQVSRIMREWRRGHATVESTRPHGIETTPSYLGSPVQYAVERREWLIRRLDEDAAREFALLGALRNEGLTHYAMAPLVFSDGAVNAASWASDAPEGFTPAQLALLRAIAPVFSLLIEMAAVRRMAGELLGTYLGRSTAGRVLAGEIRRGHMQRIEAAILVCDLRGFTLFSNSHDEAAVIDRLNRYFDAVGGAIEAQGGEILKFQGDGVMAIFRDGGQPDACDACRRAVAAAARAVAAADASAGAAIEPPLGIGIALHYGEVEQAPGPFARLLLTARLR
jgi:adenylate cyclase